MLCNSVGSNPAVDSRDRKKRKISDANNFVRKGYFNIILYTILYNTNKCYFNLFQNL